MSTTFYLENRIMIGWSIDLKKCMVIKLKQNFWRDFRGSEYHQCSLQSMAFAPMFIQHTFINCMDDKKCL